MALQRYALSNFHTSSGSSPISSYFGNKSFYADFAGAALRDCRINSVTLHVDKLRVPGQDMYVRLTIGGESKDARVFYGTYGPANLVYAGFTQAAFAQATGTATFTGVRIADSGTFSFWTADNNYIEVDYTPNASGLSLSSGSVRAGGNVSAAIAAYDASYSHLLTLTFGGKSATQSLAAGTTSAVLTVPLAWLDQIPGSASGTAYVRLDTYSGGSMIGTTTVALAVVCPESIAPDFTAACAPLFAVGGTTHPNLGGGSCVQSKSGVHAVISGAVSQYGATVVSSSITVAGTSYAAYGSGDLVLDSGLLQASGTAYVACRVTDSRGRTTTKTLSVTVVPYAAPRCTELTAFRADTLGDAAVTGVRCHYALTWTHSALGGANSCAGALQYRKVGAEAWVDCSSPAISGSAGVLASGGADVELTLTDKYEIRLILTDAYGIAERTAILPSARFAMHVSADGSGIAFGKACERLSAVEIAEAMELYYKGQTMDARLADRLDSAKAYADSGLALCAKGGWTLLWSGSWGAGSIQCNTTPYKVIALMAAIGGVGFAALRWGTFEFFIPHVGTQGEMWSTHGIAAQRGTWLAFGTEYGGIPPHYRAYTGNDSQTATTITEIYGVLK